MDLNDANDEEKCFSDFVFFYLKLCSCILWLYCIF